MKTHRETGNPGCRAMILKYFCSTACVWKLGSFITPLSGKKFQKVRTPYVDIFKDRAA